MGVRREKAGGSLIIPHANQIHKQLCDFFRIVRKYPPEHSVHSKTLSLTAFRFSLFRDALFSLVVFYDGTFSRQFFILRHLSFCDIFSAF
jgi:hypothetical protein